MTPTPREAALAAYQDFATAAFADECSHPTVIQTCTAVFNSPGVQAMLDAHERAVRAQVADQLRARADEVPETAPKGARNWARAMRAAAKMTDPGRPALQHRTNTAVLLAGRDRRATTGAPA